LVWPSVLESHALPSALRPLWDALRERQGALAHFAAVPSADFAQQLTEHQLPWTARPFHRPLADYPLWLVWMQWPHQIFGLLSILRAVGLTSRATQRPDDAPCLLAAGPACDAAPDGIRPFVDGIIPAADPSGSWWETVATATSPRSALSTMSGVVPTVESPSSRGGIETVESRGDLETARVAPPWLVQAGDLRSAFVEKTTGALGGGLWIVRPWAASARLRSAHGLPDGDAIVQAVREGFGECSEVAVELAVGLPGETSADRAAIVPLARRLVQEVPHGPKQLLVKLGPYQDPSVAAEHTPATLRERLERIATDLRAGKIRCEVGDVGCAWTGSAVIATGSGHAAVIERVHGAGARVGESALACRTDLWHKAWQAEGEAGPEPASGGSSSPGERTEGTSAPPREAVSTAAPRDEEGPATAAETGLPEVDHRREASRSPSSSPGRGKDLPDRWTRWCALAPRQFDYRFEFVKQGPMRFVGHRDLWSMWVGAIAAAGLPLATSGLVQPRPKITFGPPLPLGVEGLQEYVDVSFTRKASDLAQTLNDRFPKGLWIREAAFIPAVAGRVSLGMVTRADYVVRVAPRHCVSGSLPTPDVEARASRLRSGTAGAEVRIQRDETTIDLRTQVVSVTVREDPEGILEMTFSLDLTSAGTKARPQDVLSYLLAGAVRDLRTLPMQRLCLWVPRDASSEQLLSPMEQVRLAHRTLRARAKMCA
jgi:radical SAM-linked protein